MRIRSPIVVKCDVMCGRTLCSSATVDLSDVVMHESEAHHLYSLFAIMWLRDCYLSPL